MRRSICITEPSIAYAGSIGSWKFIYTTATSLSKGARLLFDLCSSGRDIDWEMPNSSAKAKANVIYAEIKGSKPFYAKEVEIPSKVLPCFEFTLPKDIKAGETVTFTLGAPKGAKLTAKNGSVCQLFIQRRRQCELRVAPKAKGKYEDEPAIFTLDVKGNELENIRILAPSYVTRNKRFDVTIRFEDEYGNLTNNAPEDTLIELTYNQLRENLNWKLFVPETGFLTVPNLYFNEPGIYTIKLKNLLTDEEYNSSPIKCFSANTHQLLWGITHGESERVDSTENIESCLRHFRDEHSLNFFTTSSFESEDETPTPIWKLISQNVAEFNEDDRFIATLGMQWSGVPGSEGVRQLIFAKDNKPILRKKDLKSNTVKKIYRLFSPGEMISIPSFTMGKGFEYDFKNFNPDFERVVEIYNAWGSSECTEKEGNSIPICAEGSKGIKESKIGSVREALNKNYRFGFVAGGLDDRGIYSDFFEGDQVQYPAGLTAIICKEYSRDSMMKALYKRCCYATTGERIILGFDIAGVMIGEETDNEKKPGLVVNRHISGFVAGTDTVKLIEIFRNGEIIHTIKPNEQTIEFTYDDLTPLKDVCIPPMNKQQTPFCYYYLRVTQADSHMAWTSPIWVDYIADKAITIKGAAAKKKKSTKAK